MVTEKKAVGFPLTDHSIYNAKKAFSLLQTPIKQVDLVAVCKDNNCVSGDRDRRLASRPWGWKVGFQTCKYKPL